MILFGPAGVPHSCKSRQTEDGVREVKRLGLECMEVEFVRGVKMTPAGSERVRQAVEETGVVLTAHAPYFINLASPEKDKAQMSSLRIIEAARRCHEFRGVSVTFHAAFYQDREPEVIFHLVEKALQSIMIRLQKEGLQMALSPELTGKPTQFGSLPELIRLSRIIPGVAPCIDFAHYVARDAGQNNSYQGFDRLIAELKRGLGAAALRKLHMHVSGIEWTEKGERKHLRLRNSSFDWPALLQVLVDRKVSGIMICESPVLEEDALLLKQEYQKRMNRGKGK